ncbi:unnamed protein product [Urochloa humidicola]
MDNQEHEDNSSSFDSLVEDMKSQLRNPASLPAAEDPLLISWVDDQLRHQADRGGYTPQRVRIGALHWDPSHPMEQKKKKQLYTLLPCGDEQQREQELRRYLNAMAADVKDRAMLCYRDESMSIRISDEAFACMLLLDGYFVLSCLEVAGRSVASDPYDRDVIFLVENQIPFFVLEYVHRLVVSDDDSAAVVVQGIARHIETWVVHHHSYVHTTVTYDSTVKDNLKGKPPCHLLHLLHAYFRPTAIGRRQRSGNGSLTRVHVEVTVPADNATSSAAGNTSTTRDECGQQSRWRSATYYHAAGVRLVKRELDGDEARSILDVEVRDGALHVPCLSVDGSTVTMLRNMVALEQHNARIGTHVATYCHFLSQVAGTEEDVRLLSNKGIIVHCLGKDSDVADGFANLCRGVIVNMGDPGYYYLKRVQVGLEELCKSRWRKSMAWLRHNKCSNMLMPVALVAAVILFLCTVEQSFFAALSYATGKS